ncbi:unnamed protein product, partial [Rotaria sp. Silwood2]
MSEARTMHTASILCNGKVLIVGGRGYSDYGSYLNTTELYDRFTGVWTQTGSMSYGRYAHKAVLLNNGKVLVTGGISSSGYLTIAELYDPLTELWTKTGKMTTGR